VAAFFMPCRKWILYWMAVTF